MRSTAQSRCSMRAKLRVAEPRGDEWVTNAWIKEAIQLYFAR